MRGTGVVLTLGVCRVTGLGNTARQLGDQIGVSTDTGNIEGLAASEATGNTALLRGRVSTARQLASRRATVIVDGSILTALKDQFDRRQREETYRACW